MFDSWKPLLTPRVFYERIGPYMSWCLAISILLLTLGMTAALFIVPPDYQQGDAFRILYIHVPLAAFSMSTYAFMSVCALCVYVWKLKLHDQLAHAAAMIGFIYALLTLATGSIWGKPMWGTWWLWDVRLTSELVLALFYGGILISRASIKRPDDAARVASVLALLGVVNLPIIHFSVEWWHSLHQKSTLLGLHAPTMPLSMIWPLLLMFVGFFLITAWFIIKHAHGSYKMRSQIAC